MKLSELTWTRVNKDSERSQRLIDENGTIYTIIKRTHVGPTGPKVSYRCLSDAAETTVRDNRDARIDGNVDMNSLEFRCALAVMKPVPKTRWEK